VRLIGVAARRQQQSQRLHVASAHRTVARRRHVGRSASGVDVRTRTNQSGEHVGVAVRRGHVAWRQATGIGAIHIDAADQQQQRHDSVVSVCSRAHTRRRAVLVDWRHDVGTGIDQEPRAAAFSLLAAT
jgi:hypothetical protein